jgi:hypothetical protein
MVHSVMAPSSMMILIISLVTSEQAFQIDAFYLDFMNLHCQVMKDLPLDVLVLGDKICFPVLSSVGIIRFWCCQNCGVQIRIAIIAIGISIIFWVFD